MKIVRDSAPRAGFTLVELLVVISIIGLLLVFLVVVAPDMMLRAKRERTRHFISALEQGAATYRLEFGAGRDYPPMDRGTGQDPVTGDSSRNLRYYLGTRLARPASGSAVAGLPTAPAQSYLPMIFTDDQQDSAGCLIDAWGRRFLYYNHGGAGPDPFAGPSFPGHDTLYPGAYAHIDIVSYGQSVTGRDAEGDDCKIATWNRR